MKKKRCIQLTSNLFNPTKNGLSNHRDGFKHTESETEVLNNETEVIFTETSNIIAETEPQLTKNTDKTSISRPLSNYHCGNGAINNNEIITNKAKKTCRNWA